MTDATPYRLERHPDFGFLQVRPTPTEEEITRYYANEFYSSQYPGLNNSQLEVQQRDAEFHRAHWGDICASIERLSGRSITGQLVLDVGCGWAQALAFFQERGAKCFGFDPAPEAVEHARGVGLDVRRAGMESLDVFPGQKFDVVTLLNVLEHLADPVATMREIHAKVLKPGGILVIEVPNEFNAFQVCGQKIHGLREWWVSPPAHLNYFSNESLCKLLSGTGFEVQVTEATFPLEMFLLFGDNYVGQKELGRLCHEKRMAFEGNLRRNGMEPVLREFYRGLAQMNLGRQVVAYATAAGGAGR
jgi:2-polyprenyl-3-methyl-5-hydroxy-6-metoxy-1,4-benzoquinol methylase